MARSQKDGENRMMPAEWESHEATWLSWPKNEKTFPKEVLPKVEEVYVQIIAALHKNEKVHVLVDNEQSEQRIRGIIEEHGIDRNVLFHRIKTADVWIRDYGPIFVRDRSGKLCATRWRYNAYGNKYDDLKEDDSVAEQIIGMLNIERINPEIMLEGGSIDVNGKGTMLTTEQCLLNKNRNKHLNKKQIEGYLKEYIGTSNIIWLVEGIVGDDTDGHIDDIARFVDPNTILCTFEENQSDDNYTALKKNFEILKKAKDQDGESFDVKKMPTPEPVHSPVGRLPASYANFYIGNNVVLLPVFNQKNDEKAIALLEESFPNRKVVPIYCEPLIYGFGAIHCVTQQQPK